MLFSSCVNKVTSHRHVGGMLHTFKVDVADVDLMPVAPYLEPAYGPAALIARIAGWAFTCWYFIDALVAVKECYDVLGHQRCSPLNACTMMFNTC
jgi:hypothetical protein